MRGRRRGHAGHRRHRAVPPRAGGRHNAPLYPAAARLLALALAHAHAHAHAHALRVADAQPHADDVALALARADAVDDRLVFEHADAVNDGFADANALRVLLADNDALADANGGHGGGPGRS